MLDEEQRLKLLALKKQLEPEVRPAVTLKGASPAQRVRRQEAGKPREVTKQPSARSNTKKEQPVPKGKSPERPVSLAKLAKDLGVPLSDLNSEISSRRKPGAANRPLRAIYPSYAESLRTVFTERRKWREDHPVRYRPDPSGRLTFETYERIPALEREQLTADGYLPERAELINSPDRKWPHVQRHAEGRPLVTQHARALEVPAARAQFRPFPTSISIGSSLIPKMKAVLDPMSPLGYAKFFSLMRALLALDAKISREIGSTPGYLATNRQNADIIDAVCKYGFGMFAYEQAGERLAKRAKSKPNPTRKNAIESLMRLRPMYQGLLTDVHHQRFVTWRVGEVWDFVEFRFEDMRDWLHGLETGQYVPLTTHITRVSGSSQLPSRDAALIKYMIQASENLREGNAQRTQDRSSRSAKSGEGRSNGRGSSTSNNRAVGYRAVNTWLVPINVVEGQVETELDRDFFNGSPPAPHQVRSFYRRPRGSGPNALKTEFVSAHTRGAKSLFHEPALLPSVTIVRK